MQREFFAAALGGPQAYSGLSLTQAHAGRGITPRHFNRFVQHLLAP
jgi:hemoglobin